MNVTKKEFQDEVERIASALTGLSLIGIGTQTFWPMPGFIVPHWIMIGAFYCAVAGVVVRTFAAALVGAVAMFVTFKEEKL